MIELSSLTKSYAEAGRERIVFRSLDARLEPGEVVALVGPNGAGKSTIASLIARFWDVDEGTVLVGGVDVRRLPSDLLTRQVAVVFQDYVTYELSAAENIGVGDLPQRNDRGRIQTAARRADIHATLAGLPAGYDSLLTRMYMDNADRDDPDTGVLLSGGQSQRLALARAFFRDQRDMLILDEPSAGLDPEAEADIHDRIRAYRAGQTSLLVSHRLNTIRDADRIVVLQDGLITEQGDHDSLVASGGTYARLFTMQARGYIPGARLGA
jgi:ATP-binding cassette, subfamily B, bacterial